MASLEQVQIKREGEHAVIEYQEPGVSTVCLRIGSSIREMSDRQILDLHNEVLLAQEEMARRYRHVAVEIPEGRPQISYSAQCGQWVPRGDVLRCIIEDHSMDEVAIWIDDEPLSLWEFGQLLSTYAGWGMRIVFVPEEELGRLPAIEVREPEEGNG